MAAGTKRLLDFRSSDLGVEQVAGLHSLTSKRQCSFSTKLIEADINLSSCECVCVAECDN